LARANGRINSSEEHDSGGAIGAREEGSQGGSEEADGQAPGARALGQTAAEGGEAKVSHAAASTARSVLSVSGFMPVIFGQASAARISGIASSWRNWWASQRTGEADQAAAAPSPL